MHALRIGQSAKLKILYNENPLQLMIIIVTTYVWPISFQNFTSWSVQFQANVSHANVFKQFNWTGIVYYSTETLFAVPYV